MATLTTTLRKDQPDNEGLCRIIILYREGSHAALKHSIGEKVLPSQFDELKQKVIKHPKAKEINYLIQQHHTFINDIIFDLKRQEIDPNPKNVRLAIRNGKNSNDNVQLSTIEAWEEFMNIKRNVVSKVTIIQYKTTLYHLKTYCKNSKRTLDWELFDSDFYSHWNNYFTTQCENQYGDIGLSNNSIGKYFKNLKVFLYWAVDKEYHTNLKFKKYKVLHEKIDVFPLTEFHIDKMVSFCDDTTNEFRLRRVASLFVFLAATGLRYSDAQNLRRADLNQTEESNNSDHLIKLTTKKTNTKLIIPLNHYSRKELVRNATNFIELEESDTIENKIGDYFSNENEMNKPLLPKISSVNFNKYIKEVGEKCRFNEPITVTRKSGTRFESKRFKRWEKLSSHDCRRSFITLSLAKGMRPETVMTFTGHTSFKTMLRYNKISVKQKIQEFETIWNQ